MKPIDSRTSPILITSFFRRLRGLLFTKSHGAMVILCPCKSIHTIGMRYKIDLAFIDERGTVLEVHMKLEPGKIRKNLSACLVVERFACTDAWFEPGDNLFTEKGCRSVSSS